MTERNQINAIFSDTTADYISPVCPKAGEKVNISLRILHERGKKTVELVAGENIHTMKKLRGGHGFDYYGVGVDLTEKALNYYFKVTVADKTYIYGITGIVKEEEDVKPFTIIPGFNTPDWAKGAVFYQIYVDRFNNGDKSNDVVDGEYKYIDSLVAKREWDDELTDGIHDFYGGDLQGVMDKLDYLKDLGVDVIYLNPIFVSPSNHKYDTADYDYVDPHFGVIKSDAGELLTDVSQNNTEATRFIDRITNKENLEASNELFAKLVLAAHERGIKVILDGVFNHCGSFNKWMDVERIYENAEGYEPGAYIDDKSPYHDYFGFMGGGKWPYNDKYDSWWNFKTLPKLNYTSKELYDYILKIGAKWVSAPYNADGWRLDVASDLGPDKWTNHKFWKDFNKSVKEANPDAIILAEHYGDPSEWLNGSEWDTVMNYDAFMEPVSYFLTGMEKHSDEKKTELINDQCTFWNTMNIAGSKFTTPSYLTAMNELSNHDHSRFLTRTNGKTGRVDELGTKAATEGTDKSLLRLAVMMQMTWPGAPTIYYGDEAGLAGFTDPDNRRVYPWGSEDRDLINFHKEAIKIHKEYEELLTGSLIPLPTPTGSIAYARKQAGNATLTIINNMNVTMEYKLPTWLIGNGKNKFVRVLTTDRQGYNTKQKKYKDEDGVLRILLAPGSGMILTTAKRKKTK